MLFFVLLATFKNRMRMNFFKKLFDSKISKEPTPNNNQTPLQEEEREEELSSIELEYIAIFEDPKHEELSEEKISEIIDCIVDDFFIKDNDLEGNGFDLNDKDSLFEDAARLIVASQSGSTSLLQRRLKLGYNRIGRLMDQLEAAGIVGPNQGSKVRDVIIKTESELQMFLDANFDTKLVGKRQMDKNQIFEKYKTEIERRISIRQIGIENERIKRQKDKLKTEILLREQKKQIHKEAIKELIDEGLINNLYLNVERREPIPQDVMDDVWRRDGGMCVKCGSQENLEFDHIIPFSKGGATTYRNMQILCKKCNIDKSNKIG